MANFTITNSTAMGAGNVQQALSPTYKSLLIAGNSSATTSTAGAGAYRRGKLYDILYSDNGTAADNVLEFDVGTITFGTTPSGIVNTLISSISSNFGCDPADISFVAALSMNSTAEVGISFLTEKLLLGLNQRAAYRWVANPGSEILYPANSSATGTNGLALRARSAGYTGTATATWMIQEQ